MKGTTIRFTNETSLNPFPYLQRFLLIKSNKFKKIIGEKKTVEMDDEAGGHRSLSSLID